MSFAECVHSPSPPETCFLRYPIAHSRSRQPRMGRAWQAGRIWEPRRGLRRQMHLQQRCRSARLDGQDGSGVLHYGALHVGSWSRGRSPAACGKCVMYREARPPLSYMQVHTEMLIPVKLESRARCEPSQDPERHSQHQDVSAFINTWTLATTPPT